MESPAAHAVRLARDIAIRKRDLKNYKLGGFTAAAFEQTIATLRKEGCTVILVRTPLVSQLRAMLTPEIDGQYMAYVQHIQSLYGCGFIDLSSRIPDDQFFDAHHGSRQGRVEFTGILAREVAAPAWLKLQSDGDR
jgi:hypothetical protein